MAQMNYEEIIERMKKSDQWTSNKIKKFDRYCNAKKLVQDGLIDSTEACKASEIFNPTPPSPSDDNDPPQ